MSRTDKVNMNKSLWIDAIYIIVSVLFSFFIMKEIVTKIYVFQFLLLIGYIVKKSIYEHKCFKNKESIINIFLVCIIYTVWLILLHCTSQTSYVNTNYGQVSLWLIAFIQIFVNYVCIQIFFHDFEVSKIFLASVICFGFSMMVIIPVRAAPDEWNHIYTAYKMSDVLLHTEGVSEESFPMIQQDYEIFDGDIEWAPNTEILNEYFDKALVENDDSVIVDIGNDKTISNNDIIYIVPAIGISIGRIIGCNGFFTLLLGRFCNFLVYVLLTYLAVKLCPIRKQAIAVTALLPVALQQGMSYSYDSIAISGSLFLISIGLYIYENGISSLLKKKILFLLWIIVSILVLQAKSHAYIMTVLFPISIILYEKNILTKKRAKILLYMFVGCILLYVLYAVLDWTFDIPDLVEEKYNNLKWTTDPGVTITHIINYPMDVLFKHYGTIKDLTTFYLTSMIGPLGWLNIEVTWELTYLYWIVIILSCIKTKADQIELPKLLRIAIILVSFITILGISTGLLIGWTTISSGTILGMQGRYFIPIVPCLIGILYWKKIEIPVNLDKYISSGVFLMLLWVMSNIFGRFG